MPIIAAYEERLTKRLAGSSLSDGGDRLEVAITAAGILPRGDQRILVAAAQAGDERAKELLIICNQRAVSKLAGHYLGQGLSRDDLRQEGNLGLVKAISKYAFNQDATFLTYAQWWVRQYMSRAVQEHSQVPSYMHGVKVKVEWALRRLEGRQLADPTLEQVVEEVNNTAKKPVSEAHIATALEVVRRKVTSIDANYDGGEDSNLSIGNIVADENARVDEDILRESLREVIAEHLETLTPLQRTILERRFGLGGHVATTKISLQEELGLKKTTLENHIRRAFEQMGPALARAGVTPGYMLAESE